MEVESDPSRGPAAVTGAAGHLGGNLVRALLERGCTVRAVLHRDTRAVNGLPVERVSADVCDLDSVRRAVAGVEVVYHLAGRISIHGAEGGRVRRINVDGTRNVVEACLAAGVRRLIHFSSIHALAPEPLDLPLDETRALALGRRFSAYDRSKAQAELAVLEGVERGLDAVILNPTATLGPVDYKPSRMGEVFLDLARRRLPALVDGGFTWVDARDVAQAAVAAEERGQSGERYLLAARFATFEELALLAEEATGVPPPRFLCPQWLARLGAPFALLHSCLTGRRPRFTSESLAVVRLAHRRVSTEKAERDLGFRPRPLGDTVRDVYRWFREEGSLDG